MTARDIYHAVMAIIVFFIALGLCDPAPAQQPAWGANSSGANRMDRYLTEPEQASLLKVLREAACRDVLGRRDDAMVRALLHSGMRISEFNRVTVGATLAALQDKYLFLPREHRKGEAMDLSIYLTKPLRQALQDLLKVRAELVPADGHIDDPLLVGRGGEAVTNRSIELRYKGHARMAGLARSSPHWLRHTYAMNIKRHSTAKEPLGIIQRALGHRSIASTGIYAHATREEVAQALDETAEALAPGRVTTASLRRAWEGKRAC